METAEQFGFIAGEFRPAAKIEEKWSVFLNIGTLDGHGFAIERKEDDTYFAVIGNEAVLISRDEFAYWHAQVAQ